MPACCFSRLIRAQQFRFRVPVLDGSARQCPLSFDRYSWIGLYWPYLSIIAFTTSSIGSS